MRNIFAAIFMLILGGMVTPALAETWDCTFKISSGSDAGISGKSRIEVSGGVLDWLLPPPPGGKDWSKVSYKVVENNNAGIVSISSRSQIDPQAGPVVGASIVALSKTGGNLRLGSITVQGVDDGLGGRCRKR